MFFIGWNVPRARWQRRMTRPLRGGVP
jgi:hypothetical protein